MPPASVSYGYRGKESVIQAVNDALYDGKQQDLRPVGTRDSHRSSGGLPCCPCPATQNS